ncbi:helix-turn-helix domain-containing protein [Chryseolinea lacunae]|uniref:Helix-turn-helix domain-containing protein n=1 Tax=Chryseolinea lacunae TaxID=2801331 RepID=A0ABS1L232_9BACT|nr:helix-turn-helix domain-containing protein [Chryseolinea lacunae]MBL0745750.1 helix-turn-helix domain-containing protein [Chryseolinea lacunae]
MQDDKVVNQKITATIHKDQLLTVGHLDAFRDTLLNDIRELLQAERFGHREKLFLRSSEVRKMLNISPGTLQNLRINGSLDYKKIGGIIFYRYEDIERLLNGSKTK